MKATRILIVLVATAALALSAVGIAYGYYVNTINNQTSINPGSPYTVNANTDFWGWFRGCLGFGPNQPYGSQYEIPSNSTIVPPTTYGTPQDPYQQNPNQGFYPNGYGRGHWGW